MDASNASPRLQVRLSSRGPFLKHIGSEKRRQECTDNGTIVHLKFRVLACGLEDSTQELGIAIGWKAGAIIRRWLCQRSAQGEAHLLPTGYRVGAGVVLRGIGVTLVGVAYRRTGDGVGGGYR